MGANLRKREMRVKGKQSQNPLQIGPAWLGPAMETRMITQHT
jgi:hypothetical protein